MKRKWKKAVNAILGCALSGLVLAASLNGSMVAEATSITDAQNKVNETQQLLENINEKIDSLSDEQSILNEMIDDLNAEIINAMTSIGIKEDEIAEKEQEIDAKQLDIDAAEEEYRKSKEKEEKQYADIVTQLRFMYESGDVSYTSLLMGGEGLGDALNKMDYMESVYEYSRIKLSEFETTKLEVLALWDQLEEEKNGLEGQKQALEDDKAYLEELRENLNINLAKKKQESDNYEAEIKKAKQEAAIAKTQLKKDQENLKRLQEEARKAAQANAAKNSAAANATYATTDYTKIIDSSQGSELGKQVAKYACQFIGNPYVYGGTSLTSGADCSGFIYRVYGDFNYSLPRTSYEQRSAGTGVTLEAAQPGDIICYEGHVALYIGSGLIVHASDSRTGIIIGRANYRSILTVRRIVSAE